MDKPFRQRKNPMMASPLDIIKAPRRKKDLKYRIGHKESVESTQIHPLDSEEINESYSESESDSFFDGSYNESVSSISSSSTSCACSFRTSCHSWKPSNLKSVALLPIVLNTSVATYTPAPISQAPTTTSKLTNLLRSSKLQAANARKVDETTALTYEIPEMSRLSAWRAFLAFINYSTRSANQRKDEERYPVSDSSYRVHSSEPNSAALDESQIRELDTFAEIETEACEVGLFKRKIRNRNYRVNGVFLMRYAMDCSARLNGVLPDSPEEKELCSQQHGLRKFDESFGLLKMSEISREKLWNSVVLAPRSDPWPRSTVDPANYVLSQSGAETSSIISKTGKKLPWATHQSTMKPAGRLRTSACMRSKTSPTLSQSTPQYTVRGWHNERWTPVLAPK